MIKLYKKYYQFVEGKLKNSDSKLYIWHSRITALVILPLTVAAMVVIAVVFIVITLFNVKVGPWAEKRFEIKEPIGGVVSSLDKDRNKLILRFRNENYTAFASLYEIDSAYKVAERSDSVIIDDPYFIHFYRDTIMEQWTLYTPAYYIMNEP